MTLTREMSAGGGDRSQVALGQGVSLLEAKVETARINHSQVYLGELGK